MRCSPMAATASYPYMVTQVDDTGGHVLYRRTPPPPERVIADNVDRDLVAMLDGVVTHGTGRSAAVPGHEAAGKTGTTQDFHDAWFIGFTTDYVTTVWIGNDNSSPMRNVTGGSLPAEMWKAMMTGAEEGLPAKPLDKSQPQAPVDENGLISAESGNAAVEDDSEGGASADEEAGGAKVETDTDSDSASAESDKGGGRHEHGSWWNWLFGSNGGDQTEPPRRSRPSADAVTSDAPATRPAPIAREDTPPRDVSSPRDGPPPRVIQNGPSGDNVEDDGDDAARSDADPADTIRVERLHRTQRPPPPPRAGPPPPPPPDVNEEGAQHPDGGSDDGDNDQ